MKAIKNIFNVVKGTAKRIGFVINKHSPEILMSAGIIGGVVSAVYACKQTVKAVVKAEEVKYEIQDRQDTLITEDGQTYTEEQKKADIIQLKVDYTKDVIKLYSVPVVVGVASIVCIVCSNNIMRKRAAALAAAYATLDTSFRQYRARVADKIGVEEEAKIFSSTDNLPATIDENGDIVESKEEPFALTDEDRILIFDPDNDFWSSDTNYMDSMLKNQRYYFNTQLGLCGHLFVNDVRRRFGFEPTKTGQVLGWTKKDDMVIDFNFTRAEDGKSIIVDLGHPHYIFDSLE